MHGTVSRLAGAALAVVVLAAGGAPALAGHGLSHYPSYYPHEIRIDALDPHAAAARLTNKSLHAYLGAIPGFALPSWAARSAPSILGGERKSFRDSRVC